MSRLNQVIQVGEMEGDISYYIEDYAYTYLKKQKGREKTKYFLYGEKEETQKQKKVYIYGIAEKPKMEQTYFKEYYPLGFLKIKEDEKYWITLKGQEEKITGFYVFYAPNQAMQEYLVDHQEGIKENETETKIKRQAPADCLPVKEIMIPARKTKIRTKKKEKGSLSIPIVSVVVAGMLLLVLTSANGRKKIEIFQQIITETMGNAIKEVPEDEIVIEEKKIENIEESDDSVIITESEEKAVKQEQIELPEEIKQGSTQEQATISEEIKQGSTQEQAQIQEKIDNTAEVLTQNKEKTMQEYIVKEGDTLAAICKERYGSLTNMQEICAINDIKNADYIAPGQKLYLP